MIEIDSAGEGGAAALYFGTASCDHCCIQEEFDGDFDEIVRQMKENGWKIRKVDDDWLHFCPACVEDGK